MGIFYTAKQPVAPTMHKALTDALMVNPAPLTAPQIATEVANRVDAVAQATTPEFNLRNFIGALVIAAALLITAIYVQGKGKDYEDIAKTLMTSFTSFSGIVLGLLGGEVQKSAK